MSLKPKKSFTERWEATRKMGKKKYILLYTLIWTLLFLLGNIIKYAFTLKLPDWQNLSGDLLIFLIVFLLYIPSWSANERKYKMIKEQEALQSIQDEKDSSDELGSAVFAYIDYNNKIYQLTQIDSLNESLIGEKISDRAFEVANYGYYKINNIDTDKAIALQNADCSFCKYEYLCVETFDWEDKCYQISYSGGAMEDGSNKVDLQCHIGKSLSKLGDLEIFENVEDSSNESLLVHPTKLLCETGTGKDGYFLATAVITDENTSSK